MISRISTPPLEVGTQSARRDGEPPLPGLDPPAFKPPRGKLAHPGGESRELRHARKLRRIKGIEEEDGENPGKRPGRMRAIEQAKLVALLDASLLEHPIEPPRAARLLNLHGELTDPRSVGGLPAGLARLGDFEQRPADSIDVSDTDRCLRHAAGREVLPEETGQCEKLTPLRILRLPGGIVVEGIVMDGPLRTAMMDRIAMAVAFQTLNRHAERSDRGSLANRAGLAAGAKRLLPPDEYRIKLNHASSYDSARLLSPLATGAKSLDHLQWATPPGYPSPLMASEESPRPLVVQSDSTLLLDVHAAGFDAARASISAFAELEKSPEHFHTYRISPLSLWNAASAGLAAEEVIRRLREWSRFPVPENILFTIRDTISRFGKLILFPTDDSDRLFLSVEDAAIYAELSSQKRLSSLLVPNSRGFYLRLVDRGIVKLELTRLGYPVKDQAPLARGEPVEFTLRARTASGFLFAVRDYQREAASAFAGDGEAGSGFGTIVLPCGAGKTIVGMAIMDLLKTSTLILSTNVAAVHQWIDELLDKTTLTRDEIGEYTGDKKDLKPVTIGTYQILTWRPAKEGDFPHFRIFRERNWGLIIYDEVHLLPAPVFRVTAEIQAVRRLGLTATLVREDGREEDVFSLVGPKRYDVPWKEMEAKGWIAEANCYEIRVDLPQDLRVPYATADKRQKFRIAAENPIKVEITKELIENHPEDSIMVIGQYLAQLGDIARATGAPIITGQTPNAQREEIYADFRSGKVRVIVVSKVANFAIDLPDASVAIQVSGTFGSRQEEAQRLGRILRPKERNSYFYSIVSRYTTEEEFSANRQKFLTEQGYKYHIELWNE